MASAVRNEIYGSALHWAWSVTDGDPTGDGVQVPGGSDKTIQITGNFGSGGTIVVEGSNVLAPTASDWSLLHKPDGSTITMTGQDIAFIAENPVWVRVRQTAGTGVSVSALMTSLRR